VGLASRIEVSNRGSRTRQELFPLFSDPILRDLKKTYANGFGTLKCLPITSRKGRT